MAKNYIEISPDDKEVLEILSNLNNEMGNISLNETLDIKNLKKYSDQAKKLLNKIEELEFEINKILTQVQDFNAFNYTAQKCFSLYAAYSKKATIFVYEFRTWIAQQEIQVVVQFEDKNKSLKYAQVAIQDIIPSTKLYLQKGKKIGLATSRTKLQITNTQLQNIAEDFILNNSDKLSSFTKSLISKGKKEKYGTGRIFETVLENIANDVENYSDKNFKWTIKDRIPGLRAGDINAKLTEKLIQLGIIKAGNLKNLELSLKTTTTLAKNTEIQQINQIKNELFNIVAIINTTIQNGPSEVQKKLKEIMTNTSKSGTPYQTRKQIAQELNIKINGSLSDALNGLTII
jgi:hypothetical protein